MSILNLIHISKKSNIIGNNFSLTNNLLKSDKKKKIVLDFALYIKAAILKCRS